MCLATPQSADLQRLAGFHTNFVKSGESTRIKELNFSLIPGLENIATVGLIPYWAEIFDKIIGSGTCT